MTLKSRNNLIRIFFILSFVCIAILLACFLTALITHAIVPPLDFRSPAFLINLPFAQYNMIATFVSIALFMLYVPMTLFLLLRYFENTQSNEIVFFSGVLIGFMCESARLLIPLFGLWQSYSQLLFFAGRIALFGRIVVPLCFFAAATTSGNEYRQDVERNFTIVMAIAVVCGLIFPVNTAQITTTCMIVCGFATVFAVIRLLIFLVTLGSFYINAHKHDSKEMKYITVGYAILMLGYWCLLIADNFVFMGTGTALMFAGTTVFLRNLHRLYMWK